MDTKRIETSLRVLEYCAKITTEPIANVTYLIHDLVQNTVNLNFSALKNYHEVDISDKCLRILSYNDLFIYTHHIFCTYKTLYKTLLQVIGPCIMSPLQLLGANKAAMKHLCGIKKKRGTIFSPQLYISVYRMSVWHNIDFPLQNKQYTTSLSFQLKDRHQRSAAISEKGRFLLV